MLELSSQTITHLVTIEPLPKFLTGMTSEALGSTKSYSITNKPLLEFLTSVILQSIDESIII